MESYCNNCESITPFEVTKIKDKINIKGKEYQYIKKETYCKKCGEKILVNEIMDENVLNIQKVYREKEGYITVQQIQQIVDKYNIGKRNLSLLLGFGEITLTRYLDMDMPTKLYSDILLEVLYDYNKMLELATANKSKVSDEVYNKLLRAIEAIKEEENNDKIICVTKYILNKLEDVTNLAVQKLLFNCQLFSYAINDKALFKDDCQAWMYGPVYPNIYYKFKKYDYSNINKHEFKDYSFELIGDDDKKVIDCVIACFGKYSGLALKEMSHKTTPWIKARNGLLDTTPSDRTIKKKDIESYAHEIFNEFFTYDIKLDEFCEKYISSLCRS